MPNISVRIPDDLDERLSLEAEQTGRGRSDIARDAIYWYLDTQEKQRFMRALLDDAKKLSGADTVNVSEEYLKLDNESLAIGEPHGKYKTRKKK